MDRLPEPEAYRLPLKAIIAIPPDGLVVFRLLRGTNPALHDFEPQTLVRATTAGTPEILRLGFSHFLTIEGALSVRRNARSGIARLRLAPKMGIHAARTGRTPGHVSVWANPSALVALAETVEEAPSEL